MSSIGLEPDELGYYCPPNPSTTCWFTFRGIVGVALTISLTHTLNVVK